MKYLANKLSKKGYCIRVFSYPTVKKSLADNAKSFSSFIHSHNQPNQINHFVGHSLGGLLIRKTYQHDANLFNGAIVTLGSPHNGSIIAKQLTHIIHKQCLGKSFKNGLDGNELPNWHGDIPLGSIAGTKNIGINTILQKIKNEKSDGTVAVRETQLRNQADHICLPLTHSSLLISKQVVEQTDYFFKNYQFNH